MTVPGIPSDQELSSGAPGTLKPTVHVIIEHPTMRRLIITLLQRDCGCLVIDLQTPQAGADRREIDLQDAATADIVVIDAAAFNTGDQKRETAESPSVIVIAPAPDTEYRRSALERGAHGWIPRERVGDDLPSEIDRILARGATV